MNTTAENTEQHPVKIERFSRNLKVLLSDDQVLERARRAAAIAGEVQNKEAERDAAKKHANAQIEELEAELGRLNGEVRDGATYRDVACERRYIYRLGVKHEVRLDTGTVIPNTEQPLTDRERQLELGTSKEPHADGIVEDDYDPFANEEPPLETSKPRGKGKRGGK